MLVMEADVEEGDLTLAGAANQGTDEFMDGTCEDDVGDVYDLDWTISAMPAEGEEVEADIVPLDVDGADDAAAFEPPPPKPAEESDVFNLREKLYAKSTALPYTYSLQQVLPRMYGQSTRQTALQGFV